MTFISYPVEEPEVFGKLLLLQVIVSVITSCCLLALENVWMNILDGILGYVVNWIHFNDHTAANIMVIAKLSFIDRIVYL